MNKQTFKKVIQSIKAFTYHSVNVLSGIPTRFYNVSNKFLVKRGMRKFALFLSHGGVHFFMACIVIALCILLWQGTIIQTSPGYKEVNVTINSDSYNAKLNSLRIDIGLNSENLKKEWGYDQGMSVAARFEKIQLDTVLNDRGDTVYLEKNRIFYPQECPYPGLNKKNILKASLIINTPNSKFHFKKEQYDKNNTCISFSSILLHIDSIADNYVKCDSYYSLDETSYMINSTVTGYIFSDENNKSPYYRIFLNLNFPMMSDSFYGEEIGLYYSDIEKRGALNILNVFPQPDVVRPDFIGWRSKEKIQEIISNSGILLFFEDLNKKAKTDREVFLCTVMLGAALAFLLDIIVNLIIKWRNLVRKMDELS